MLYAYSDILFRKNGISEFSAEYLTEVAEKTLEIVQKIAKKLEIEI